jgi:hypothetical protein
MNESAWIHVCVCVYVWTKTGLDHHKRFGKPGRAAIIATQLDVRYSALMFLPAEMALQWRLELTAVFNEEKSKLARSTSGCRQSVCIFSFIHSFIDLFIDSLIFFHSLIYSFSFVHCSLPHRLTTHWTMTSRTFQLMWEQRSVNWRSQNQQMNEVKLNSFLKKPKSIDLR